MTTSEIPDIIVGRLPRYLRTLELMHDQGIATTSSKDLGDQLGISAAQIRKDLSQFGGFGKQGTGYNIPYLIQQLRAILNVDRVWDMAVIGAGDLGHALARYQGFLKRGFRVAMVFDNNPEKIGKKIGDIIIQDSSEMIPAIRGAGIKIAMLTVPGKAAQDVTDDLVKAGIRAILSYAPIVLTVPDDVHVQNIDPVTRLQRMTYYLD
ncbi:MAG: redox-sensing transcriptional repressor Rex [Anaerolineaceae bacterium]